jgi:hypothetical protein
LIWPNYQFGLIVSDQCKGTMHHDKRDNICSIEDLAERWAGWAARSTHTAVLEKEQGRSPTGETSNENANSNKAKAQKRSKAGVVEGECQRGSVEGSSSSGDPHLSAAASPAPARGGALWPTPFCQQPPSLPLPPLEELNLLPPALLRALEASALASELVRSFGGVLAPPATFSAMASPGSDPGQETLLRTGTLLSLPGSVIHAGPGAVQYVACGETSVGVRARGAYACAYVRVCVWQC